VRSFQILHRQLATGGWLLATGGWLLAAGIWHLAVGGWRLAAGYLTRSVILFLHLFFYLVSV